MDANENKTTKEQLYAKAILLAKSKMDQESLAKKKKKFSGLLSILWFILILLTLLIYFWMSHFTTNTFLEFTSHGLGYWTIARAFFLGLIFILIIETRKPDSIKFTDICKKADKLIEEKKKRLTQEHSRNKQELELFNEFF